MSDGIFQTKLSEITAAGYVDGFMACIIRIGEEAIRHPGQSQARLIEKLNAEIAQHPGHQLGANALTLK